MTHDHRQHKVPYPDAPPGTCNYCGQPCAGQTRGHQKCADRHKAGREYRANALAVTGGWCIEWEDGLCKGKVEGDHVHELADNGPKDWTLPRCQYHHNIKTQAARAARKEGKPMPKSSGAKPDTKSKPKSGGKGGEGMSLRTRIGAGLGLITLAVVLYRVDPSSIDTSNPDAAAQDVARALLDVLITVAIVAVVIGAIAGALIWRAHQRRATLLGLTEALARETQTNPVALIVRARRWSKGIPVRGTCDYSALFDDEDGSGARAKVEAMLDRKIGTRLAYDWNPPRNRVTWRPHPDGPLDQDGGEEADDTPDESAARKAVTARFSAGVEAALGSSVTVRVEDWHDGAKPARVAVGYTALAKVHDDRTKDAVEDKVATLVSGAWRAVWDTQHDRVVFTDTPDPLAPIAPLAPLPDKVDLGAVPCGLRDDGKPWTVKVAGSHILIAGASGAGKGSVLWSILRGLAPAVADGTCTVWAIDPKGGVELGKGEQMFAQFETQPEERIEMLESAVVFMEKRLMRMRDRGERVHTPTVAEPMLVVVIDEFAVMTAYSGAKAERERAEGALNLLLSQGRAARVSVIGALQDPRKEVLKMRDLFMTRISLRVNEASHCDMVLGSGARTLGARADRIDEGLPGVGYMMSDGTVRPIRFRTSWVDDPDIEEMAGWVHETRQARLKARAAARSQDAQPALPAVPDDVVDQAPAAEPEDPEHVVVAAPPAPVAAEPQVSVLAPPGTRWDRRRGRDLVPIKGQVIRFEDGDIGTLQGLDEAGDDDVEIVFIHEFTTEVVRYTIGLDESVEVKRAMRLSRPEHPHG